MTDADRMNTTLDSQGASYTGGFKKADGRLPVSVSVETASGLCLRVMEMGDSLPKKVTRTFSSDTDSPDALAVRLYAGERPFARYNRRICEMKIDGIRRLSFGRPAVTVEIEIDREWNINVSITDEGSLSYISHTVSDSWVPSSEEIFSMINEAKVNMDKDNELYNRATLIQRAKELLRRADMEIKTKGKNMSSDRKKSLKRKMNRIKSRIKKDNPEKMTRVDAAAIADAIKSLNNGLM